MDEMMGITLDELGKRYGEDELRLVMGLMRLGMISDKAPECHGVMKIHPSKPKHWRCSRTKAVITSDSFFYGFKDIYGTMKVIYMWGQEYPPRRLRRRPKRRGTPLPRSSSAGQPFLTVGPYPYPLTLGH